MGTTITPSAVLAPRQSLGYGGVWQGHPGHGASIETLKAVERLAEQGRPAQQCDLYDDLIQRDDALAGLVRARTAALSGRPSAIIPGGDDLDSQAAAEIFAELWDDLPARRVISHHARSANVYGWACSEIEWTWTGTRYDPTDLYQIRSRFFRIATEFDRVVVGAVPDELLPQIGLYEHEVARMIPGKWIVTRANDSELVARSSLMRPSALASILKSMGWAGWLMFVNRYGLPFAIAKVHDFANAQDVATARGILESLGRDAGAVVAENSKVTLDLKDGAQPSRAASSDVHQRFVDGLNTGLTRIWNGGVLASEAGGNGSFAQAKVHDGIRVGNIREDADRVADSIREHLIKPWMRINAIRGKAPHLSIKLSQVQDAETAVKLLVELDKLGIQGDLQQIQDLTGLKLTAKESPSGQAE
jgi:phage gp29-like protein